MSHLVSALGVLATLFAVSFLPVAAVGLLVNRRIPSLIVFATLVGWAWLVLGVGLLSAYPPANLTPVYVALLGALPHFAWMAVRHLQAREVASLTRRGAERVGEGRWRIRVGTTDVQVEQVDTGWGVRVLDRRAHVFSVALPLGDTAVLRRARRDPDARRSLLPPVEDRFVDHHPRWLARRYIGPPHVASIWLAGDVPERLLPLLDRRDARLERGVLTVRTRAWLGEAEVGALVAELFGVVAAVRASGQGAIARVQAEARGADPARVEAWRTLADHLPEGLREVAAEGLRDPDPVVRVIAGRALRDRAVIAAVLATAQDAEALRRAAEAVRAAGWEDLVGAVLARVGLPPESVWFELVQVVGAVGGPAHVPRLTEVAEAPGYSPELRAEARAALARIRGRAGTAAVGRLALAGPEGGELAMVGEGGEVSVVGEGVPASRA